MHLSTIKIMSARDGGMALALNICIIINVNGIIFALFTYLRIKKYPSKIVEYCIILNLFELGSK